MKKVLVGFLAVTSFSACTNEGTYGPADPNPVTESSVTIATRTPDGFTNEVVDSLYLDHVTTTDCVLDGAYVGDDLYAPSVEADVIVRNKIEGYALYRLSYVYLSANGDRVGTFVVDATKGTPLKYGEQIKFHSSPVMQTNLELSMDEIKKMSGSCRLESVERIVGE